MENLPIEILRDIEVFGVKLNKGDKINYDFIACKHVIYRMKIEIEIEMLEFPRSEFMNGAIKRPFPKNITKGDFFEELNKLNTSEENVESDFTNVLTSSDNLIPTSYFYKISPEIGVCFKLAFKQKMENGSFKCFYETCSKEEYDNLTDESVENVPYIKADKKEVNFPRQKSVNYPLPSNVQKVIEEYPELLPHYIDFSKRFEEDCKKYEGVSRIKELIENHEGFILTPEDYVNTTEKESDKSEEEITNSSMFEQLAKKPEKNDSNPFEKIIMEIKRFHPKINNLLAEIDVNKTYNMDKNMFNVVIEDLNQIRKQLIFWIGVNDDVQPIEIPSKSRLSPFSDGTTVHSSYGISLENTTKKTKSFYIFDYINNHNEKENIDLKGVNILRRHMKDKLGWEEVNKLFKDVAFYPKKCSLIRMVCDNPSQKDETIVFSGENRNGSGFSQPIIPKEYWSEKQHQKQIIDIPFRAEINGRTKFLITLLPNTKLDLTFFD